MIVTHEFESKVASGAAAAALGAAAIADTIAARGHANIVVATGASQFEMLDHLVAAAHVDWSRVSAFHLDEYVGIAPDAKASFRRYLRERFTHKLPALGAFTFIEGDAENLDAELERLNLLLDAHPIDVMFAGIGENGHLAFNDPPADFTSTIAYKLVELDLPCRQQQVREGWFADLDAVPLHAISMTVQRILSSRTIVLTVSDERKADAVQKVLGGEISNLCPASILQQHDACHLFLDRSAAMRLSPRRASLTA
ncbi:glucosamine-6-phosphate deaminase [Devosia sp. Root413D1]|uniref:glucosamine-6-phosphate deaminase n=1 Tax=Devosia sp. Root413D1 TaxID=1736531 RepID=UPI0006F32A44|nr:glucosamine-6-phosphate deaminase [Devosia sp. Root413D1]KQW77600.1 glucosamine-6-phosphate deaminase [Devosia sp. Root413D1]